MRSSNRSHSRRLATPPSGHSAVRTLVCGVLAVATLGVATAANATSYDESVQGDLSDSPSAPTSLGALSLGGNSIVGSSIPSGQAIPNGHGALAVQDNDFFTFTITHGEVLSQFNLASDSTVNPGDRFFLGIYAGNTSPVDPANPSPAGLLGYTLPGAPQIGTDLLPALAASNEPTFPPLPTHFSGSLGAGTYTVWLVDGDSPVHYDLDLTVSPVPEPATWAVMIAGFGLTGAMLRRRGVRTNAAVAS